MNNPSMYEIGEAFRCWEEKLYSAEGEVTPELLDEIREIEGNLQEKAEACAVIIREREAYIAMLGAEQDRLAQRKASLKNTTERIRARLAELMTELHCEKVETPRFAIGFRKSSAVVIDDESKIPEEYIKVTTERMPMKKELCAALKGGDIPGCHLEERRNLQIK